MLSNYQINQTHILLKIHLNNELPKWGERWKWDERNMLKTEQQQKKAEWGLHRLFYRPVEANSLWRWTLSHPSPWVSQVACTLHWSPWKRQGSYLDSGSRSSLFPFLFLFIWFLPFSLTFKDNSISIYHDSSSILYDPNCRTTTDELFLHTPKWESLVITWTNTLKVFVNLEKKKVKVTRRNFRWTIWMAPVWLNNYCIILSRRKSDCLIILVEIVKDILIITPQFCNYSSNFFLFSGYL